MRQALESEKCIEWCVAMNDEIDGLTRMCVVKHDQTRQDIIDHGITAIPVGIYFDEKLNPLGEVIQEKARAEIKG